MKWNQLLLTLLFICTLVSTGWAQQTQPAPTTTPPAATPPPSPTPASTTTLQGSNSTSPTPKGSEEKSDIPVVKMGGQIQPIPPEKTEKTTEKTKVEKTTPKPSKTEERAEFTVKEEKPRKVTPKVARPDEIKSLTVELKQLVHSKASEVGDPVLLAVAENTSTIQKGNLIFGKISEIEKIKKNEPGRIKISLNSILTGPSSSSPLSGVLEVTREKGQDGIEGKEVFIPVGFKQKVTFPKKVNLRGGYRASKSKGMKGILSAPVDMGEGASVKLSSLKYPSKLEVYIEPPQGLQTADLKEDSFKLIRVNDFNLPTAISPLDEKIKVADHNKNNAEDLRYLFNGWEVIQYLPEGNSKLVFSALTQKGKSVEAIANFKIEYQ